ncbi:P-loop containing nucleoside triphosphate hydrolase protein [Mycena leptocephala]|nr:P-loop containing nucleoside triphosphate hydrolase protein [Mycena leptocephala]
MLVPQVPQPIKNCPPPTRIFHGRRTILDNMHQYFMHNMGNQRIFLLYGLGGAGKTQIALKFIQESASRFTDIFLIDMSTVGTIDSGLKNIATIKGVGDTCKGALEWLKSEQHEWLLFFDNADDPKIDLNNYFPHCSHGNIIITSRNPGLCVYTSAHCAVADMEEPDSVDLLLRSAAQDLKDHNKEIAAQIVKVLCFLPLVIIQAGAFISKSGNLDSYLALYAHNKAQLLSARPAQSHDNYAWTVYTTWQISFDQLSEQATTFLKLCSFLHYQGICEEIFKNATKYKLGPSSASQEEIEMPLRLLSQFLGPSGAWDPLCFLDMINEIRAYSLINFDSEKGMFSIHPLVHDWTRSTISHEEYHHCMITIAGMSLAGLSEGDITTAGIWMLPHIEFLMKGYSNVIPDFRHEYGKVYLFAGKLDKAEKLQVAHRNVVGDDHPGTLSTMGNLALTYGQLGKFREAEELGLIGLEKRRNILGDNHPDTLVTMGNLALTYHRLGRLQEAEVLHMLVLEKRRKILGDYHPETLLNMGNLANTYKALGKLHEAEQLELMVLERRRSILGDDHPDTLLSMANIGATYNKLGRLQEAEELEVVVLEWRRNILGSTLNKLERWQEAEELLVVALEKQRALLADNHPHVVGSTQNLAVTYTKLGKLKEAEDLNMVLKSSQV